MRARSSAIICAAKPRQWRSPLPKGPHGEKRPADVIGDAIKIARIATDEEKDDREPVKSASAELGSKGGRARAATLSGERRREIARDAARIRWKDQTPARSGKKELKDTTQE